jgi:hypothetical protein
MAQSVQNNVVQNGGSAIIKYMPVARPVLLIHGE